MARCFDESQEGYKRGDGARAKELSNQGKEHKAKMERLNKEASDWIYVSEYPQSIFFSFLFGRRSDDDSSSQRTTR